MSTPNTMVFPAETAVARPQREAAVGFMNINLGGSGKLGDKGIAMRASKKAEAYVHDLYVQAVAKGKVDEFNQWLASAITVSYNSATPTGGVAVNAQELPEITFL